MNATTPKQKLITTQSAYGTAAASPAPASTEKAPAPIGYQTETIEGRIRAYQAAGINCLPAWGNSPNRPENRSPKAPEADTWTEQSVKRQTAKDYDKMIAAAPDAIGIVCGKTSGIEALDFDQMKAYEDFLELAAKAGLEPLIKRIAAGYTERSPKGVHWLYRLKLKAGQAFPGNKRWATAGKGEKDKSHNRNQKPRRLHRHGAKYGNLQPNPRRPSEHCYHYL